MSQASCHQLKVPMLNVLDCWMSYCILILVAGSALYLEPISKGADLGGFLWAGFCRIDLSLDCLLDASIQSRAFQMKLGYASLKRSPGATESFTNGFSTVMMVAGLSWLRGVSWLESQRLAKSAPKNHKDVKVFAFYFYFAYFSISHSTSLIRSWFQEETGHRFSCGGCGRWCCRR